MVRRAPLRRMRSGEETLGCEVIKLSGYQVARYQLLYDVIAVTVVPNY
jgi:hypothetical protein